MSASAEMEEEAKYYDDYWAGVSGWKPPAGLDADLRSWIEPLLAKGRVVLDVGCGDGARYGARVSDGGMEVHGVDISQVAVDAARAVGIDARVASLDEPLPYPDCTFDVVICLEVLEHLVNPGAVVREIRRVLKPGGRSLMSVPNSAFWATRVELLLTGHFNPRGSPMTQRATPWRDPHLRFFNFRSMSAMTVEGGMSVIRHGGLECQFLRVAGIERLFGAKHSWLDTPFESIGAAWPSLLARRCIVLAERAERA